ncbi:MAG: hypothetical protein WCJ74_01190 [bacterium]
MEESPTIALNREHVFGVYERFTEEFNKPDRESYISYFDVKKISEIDPNTGDDEYCIVVGLRDKLPAGLELPERYLGVKIYTK